MTSIRQGIERQREQGTDLPSGTVSVRDLMRRFPPPNPGSTSSLITTMLAGARTPFNWAVILCRFSDTPSDPAIESLFRRAFAPGSGGLVEYWSDVSLGKIDISGSTIFGWVTLDITRAQASVGNGMNRRSLTAKAVEAATRAGLDVKTGFNSQMAVLTHNWTRDDLTPEQMTGDDRYTWWIDGSSDGSIVCAHPLLHHGDLLAHEMGHVHQFDHDYAADLTTAYGDPFCLMSAANNTGSFVQPDTNLNYGPAICLPHLTQFGWHYPRRILQNPESWQTSPAGVTFTLATVDDLAAPGANLGAVLPLRAPLGWSYQLEYARRVGWNRGLRGDELLIRRWFTSSVGDTAALLATVVVPDTVSGTASVTEPRGNTEFTVQRIDAPGRTIQVTARKL